MRLTFVGSLDSLKSKNLKQTNPLNHLFFGRDYWWGCRSHYPSYLISFPSLICKNSPLASNLPCPWFCDYPIAVSYQTTTSRRDEWQTIFSRSASKREKQEECILERKAGEISTIVDTSVIVMMVGSLCQDPLLRRGTQSDSVCAGIAVRADSAVLNALMIAEAGYSQQLAKRIFHPNRIL